MSGGAESGPRIVSRIEAIERALGTARRLANRGESNANRVLGRAERAERRARL